MSSGVISSLDYLSSVNLDLVGAPWSIPQPDSLQLRMPKLIDLGPVGHDLRSLSRLYLFWTHESPALTRASLRRKCFNWEEQRKTMPKVRVSAWSSFECCVPRKKKEKETPTRDIKDTPTLHRSMLFFSSGRTIPAIPWRNCYAPKASPVRGFPLIWGPTQPPTSMMRFCIPARFKFPR